MVQRTQNNFDPLLISSLRASLMELREDYPVVSLKSGTEIEDMSFEEISFLREISQGVLPLIIKIGGPEARQDIRNCLNHRVDVILAPMVESVYALSNFVATVKEISEEQEKPMPSLAINLETYNAYTHFDNMMESSAFEKLSQVTVGRGDFSKSMHLDVDDEEVIQMTNSIVHRVKRHGYVSSVGGGLNIKTIGKISQRIETARFNSRHVGVANNYDFRSRPIQTLYAMLQFENELYMALNEQFPQREKFYQKRMDAINKRCGNLTLVEEAKKIG